MSFPQMGGPRITASRVEGMVSFPNNGESMEQTLENYMETDLGPVGIVSMNK